MNRTIVHDFKNWGITLVLPVIALLFSSCAGTVNYRALNSQVRAVVREANDVIEEGKIEEGIKMLQVVKQIHPNDPAIKKAEKQVPKEQLAALKVDPMLGFNKAQLRAKIIPTTARKVLLYIPDRIKDFIDMVTLDVNVGPQLGAGLWLTRAVQAQAYVGSSLGLGYHQKTLLGFRGENNAELVLGPVGGSAVVGGSLGLGGMSSTLSAIVKHTPSQKIYQEYRDYWALGAKFGFFVIGFEVEYHPLEIFDFLAGFLLIDPLNDDLATTRRLKFNREQRIMMKSLATMTRKAGKKGLEEYAKKYPRIFPKKEKKKKKKPAEEATEE